MFRRTLLSLPFLLVVAVSAEERAPITYTLRFPEASAHYVEVEATIPTGGKPALELFMPVWTPGSYLVREYAGHIVGIRARTAADGELTLEKTSKNRWALQTRGQSSVRVRYRLFGRDINVRGNWVESGFAVINGAPTFLSVVDDWQRPYRVRLELPPGWKSSHTPLTPADAPHTYEAPDFDTLVDSPIIAGSPLVDSFEVDGVRHTLVTLGGDEVWDNARVAHSLKRLVETQRTFWGGLPYHTPYYFFNLLTGSRGGLEHRNALTMSADRWLSRTRGGITSWLSLASHEYFHAWNGKRLRPVELGPFDYEHEAYSKSLWVVEGITSYYQHVLLARAGFYTRDQYLGAVSGSIAGVEKTPGRHVQSLSDSSFDSWIKAYRPDENSVNALFSYYSGGSVAGLLLDAEIQRVSAGARSLDDVMRAAYARYGGETGYTEAQFIALAGEIAGGDMSGWFRRVIQSPGEFDYQPMLDWYGLEFEKPAEPAKSPSAWQGEPKDPPKGWLGADVGTKDGRSVITVIRTGTPAANAGLSVNDEVLAIDDYRVGADNFVGRVGLYPPGAKVAVLVSRQERLLTIPVILAEQPGETWKLKFRADATDAQKARIDCWLGGGSKPPQ